MGDAWTIATKDLRRRLRDRTALLVAFVLPLGLAWIFSLTLGDVETRGLEATYAVVDEDPQGELAHALTDALGGLDFVTLREVTSSAEAERLAEDGDLDAAIVVPQGFDAGVRSGAGGTLRVIGAPDSSLSSLILVSIARSFAADLDAIGLSVAVAGAEPDPALVERARAVDPPARLDAVRTDDRSVSASTFFAIGMAVFFLFFTVEFGVRSLLEEREEGTLARLLVAPIRPTSVVAGKAAASLAVGLVSTTLLVFATTWLLDATWGDPLGVALLVGAGVLSAVGVTALVSTFARTTAQAGAMVSIVAVVGGLLGGTFFPISQAGWLSSVRFLSPQGWLMEGFQEAASGGTLGDLAGPLVGVVAIAVVASALAWVRATKLVAR
jgi:ABC-2 type transport system permease protein